MYPCRIRGQNVSVSTLNFATLNVNGLARKLRSHYLTENIEKYDFIGMVETWCTKQSNLKINGYTHYMKEGLKNTKKGRRSGGVAFYFKNKFRHAVHQVPSANKYCMWIQLDSAFFGFERDIYVCIVYVKPGSAKLRDQYFTELENDIVKYKSKGNVILSGDFNARTGTERDYISNDDSASSYIMLPDSYTGDVPLHRNNSDNVCNGYGTSLLDMCCNHGIRILNGRMVGDLLGSHTFHSAQGVSCVDYTVVDVTLLARVRYFSIADPDHLLSDHCLQRYGLKCILREENTVNPNILTPLYDKFEWSDDGNQTYMMALLEPSTQQKLLNFVTQSLDCHSVTAVTDAVVGFTDILTSAGMTGLKFIKRSKKKTNNRKRRKPGFDQECYALRKEVRSLGRALRRNPYNKQLRDKFIFNSKKYKKMLKKKEKSVRSTLINNLCTLQSQNPKQFWKIVDQLKTKSSNPVEDIKPEEWLGHFKTLYTSTMDSSLDNDIKQREGSTHESEQLNKAFTIGEVKKHIKKLKNNKATGSDLVMNEMLKCGSPILLPATCKLFNFILDSGIFPEEWNTTFQVPLYKAGDPMNCNNYRGIAISSCLGKLFTNILQSRLLSFVEDNNKLSENQAAFRPGKSTIDHIFCIKSIVNRYIRFYKKELFCCFVDFSKAFDSVWREGMFYKLLGLDINGKCYRIIKHMYMNSKTSVKLPMGLTENFHTNIGIRQDRSPSTRNMLLEKLLKLANLSTAISQKLLGRFVCLNFHFEAQSFFLLMV